MNVNLQVSDLEADTRYMFAVRAENSVGLSVPSPVSETVRTLKEGGQAIAPHLLDEARNRLATRSLSLKDVSPISSSSVKVEWEVGRNFFISVLMRLLNRRSLQSK